MEKIKKNMEKFIILIKKNINYLVQLFDYASSVGISYCL